MVFKCPTEINLSVQKENQQTKPTSEMRRRTSTGFEPVTSRGPEVRLLYAIVKIAFITAKIIASLDCIIY